MNNKKLLNLGVAYSISSILVQALNMLLVPIYTTYLTIEQFGELNLVNSMQAMVSIFVSLGIYSGLSRFYKEYEDGNRLKNIALLASLVWSVFMIALVYVISPYLAQWVLPDQPFGYVYLRYIGCISASFTVLTIYSAYFSMQYQVGKFSLVNLGRALLMVGISYFFLRGATEEIKIIEALQAQLYANGIVLFAVIAMDIRNIRFEWGKKEFFSMFKYGVGLMPGEVSSWIYNLIDRYFINNAMGLRAVALYSMGYRVGMLMEPLFISPFKSVFTAYKYSVYKQENGKELIANVYQKYNFVGWYVLLIISVAAKIAIAILSTAEYLEAYLIVPYVLMAYFLYGLGEFYALGIHLSNKTWLASLIYTVSAITNIIFNILLITPFGLYGAAIATLGSSFIVNVIQFYVGRKYYDLNLSLFSPYKYLLIVLPLYISYVYLSGLNSSIIFEFLLILVIVILFPLLAVVFKFIPKIFILNLVDKARVKSKNILFSKGA